jgi:cholesterol transport system auxiliary component
LNSGTPRYTGAKALFVLAFTVLLTGCGAFRGPPPVTYDLAAPESIPQVNAGTAAQIMIPEPKAIKVLDSENIVVTSGPTISYYPEAQWPDRLPKLFQARAIEAFEQSRRARAVGRPGEGLSIDYQVLIDIRSFAFDTYGSRGIGRVEVFAKLVNDRNGRVVANRKIVGEAPVGRDDAQDVVAGLNAAMDQVLVELVRWTVSNI